MSTTDIVIRRGTVYDGTGAPPRIADVTISGDRISDVGDAPAGGSATEIDADGLAVAPGFINMLSWSVESLIEDGRSQSEIRQGVTLEVMGEGTSMGPLTPAMAAHISSRGILGTASEARYEIGWQTLAGYLEWLERRGVSPNVASFVGTGTLRTYAVGHDDRPADDDELTLMCRLLTDEMERGAMGVASSLIYAPDVYSSTDELVALAGVAAEHGGMYVSHMRSEGSTFLEALDELIEIARRSGVRAEVYHLKAAGRAYWNKMDAAIGAIEAARADGLAVTADMYPYEFAGTGLDACIPPWAHEGGSDALLARLQDGPTRVFISEDMLTPSSAWENMFLETRPENILLCGFRDASLDPLRGRTLADVAQERGTSPDVTIMDLLAEDGGRIETMYRCISEENIRLEMRLPWMSFCSDEASQAPEGSFLRSNPHPRAYGAFARVLGRYVRELRVISLEDAIRRMTSLPAANLGLEGRGHLRAGDHADVAVFDPTAITDHATPKNPHRYATGMVHVFVNGVQVLADGEHTGATPGRFVRGPGWTGRSEGGESRRGP